jgi:hypothetical protein
MSLFGVRDSMVLLNTSFFSPFASEVSPRLFTLIISMTDINNAKFNKLYEMFI